MGSDEHVVAGAQVGEHASVLEGPREPEGRHRIGACARRVSTLEAYGSGIGTFVAAQDVEEGRFPRPVRADESGPGAGKDLETGVAEQDLSAVLLGDIGKMDHAGLRSSMK